MLYAEIKDDVVVDYPVNLSQRFPYISFSDIIPDEALPENIVRVVVKDQPTHDMATHKVAQREVPINVDGVWTIDYDIIDLSDSELQSNVDSFKQVFVNIVQNKLDAFAAERDYFNIISACSYATSSNVTFATEAAICIAVRDQMWSAAYALLDSISVDATLPTIQELVDQLPTLSWEV